MTENHHHDHHDHDHSAHSKEWADLLVLAALGAFLAWLFASGRVHDFLAARYVWLTPTAAGVLTLMVLAGVFRQREGEAECEGCAGDHPRDLPRLVSRCVLLAPVAAMLWVSPTRLSDEGWRKRQVSVRRPVAQTARASGVTEDAQLDAALRWIAADNPVRAAKVDSFNVPRAPVRQSAPTATQETSPLPPSALVPEATAAKGVGAPSVRKPSGGPRPSRGVLRPGATLLDLQSAIQEKGRSALTGTFVTVTGRAQLWAPGRTERFDLMRLVVTCCIADARPALAEVVGVPGVSLDEGQWVRVAGTLQFDSQTDPDVPVIKAASIQKIPEPQNPYL